MNSSSIWLKNATLPNFGELDKTVSVDVAIIGGGMTGLTAAYLLARSGARVAVVERYRLGHGDTANTTAHLTYVTDRRLADLVRSLGTDRAKLFWQAGQKAIDEIEKIVIRENIHCDFSRIPGFLIPSLEQANDDMRESLAEEARLAREMGFDIHEVGDVIPFRRPGIRYDNQAKFNALDYLAGLVQAVTRFGGLIFENSSTTTVEGVDKDKGGGVRLKTDHGEVNCDRIIVATHSPITGLNSTLDAMLLQSKLFLYSSYVIAGTLPPALLDECCIWDTTDPYYYLRVDRTASGERFIFGGQDHKTGQCDANVSLYGKLAAKLQAFIPEAKVTDHWSGQIITTADGLPYIGVTDEQQFVATGFCGNGITLGTAGAIMASDWILERPNPWTELFSPQRHIPLSRSLQYIRENLDFPYYGIKDQFPMDDTTQHSVRPGTGAIVQENGKQIAIYRPAEGKLIRLSARCPHLGCTVHWNDAEATWDCPCHGSRFRPTGEVIAGPAESDLQRV